MNMFIHNMDGKIVCGDTMKSPLFIKRDGSLKTFDRVTGNPMWNQNFPREVYENDRYHRFNYGYPPSGSADWGWIQHMYKSLDKNGKMAVVLDVGAVSRGSGSTRTNTEKLTRKAFIDNNLVESVILLPGNLFYNTSAPGIILVINNRKSHHGIFLIDATSLLKKGKPKNYLPMAAVEQIFNLYSQRTEVKSISKIITTEEAVKNDYNLSPSRFMIQDSHLEPLSLQEASQLLQAAEQERVKADANLERILKKIGLNI
jgi:type I restriction enzyme M protein